MKQIVTFNPASPNDVKEASKFLTNELGFEFGSNRFRNLDSLVGTIGANKSRVSEGIIKVSTEGAPGDIVSFDPVDDADCAKVCEFLVTERGFKEDDSTVKGLDSVLAMIKINTERVKEFSLCVI